MASGLEIDKLCNCGICVKYFPAFQRWSSHMPRFSFLEESAKRGCCLCALLHRKVSQAKDELEMPHRIDLDQTHIQLTRNRRLLGFNFEKLTGDIAEDGSEKRTTHYGPPSLYIAPMTEILPSLNLWEKGAIITLSTSSESCQQLARSWLRDCKDNHEKCSSIKANSSWFPTRLIDLQRAIEPTGAIRIIDTATHTPEGVYACLSHCWGGHQPVTLTTETYEMLKSGIPTSDLPRTFREAVQVCHWFNVRYLWIDSLCIIQGSRQDWEQEAPKMRLVYKNGELTIAATDGRNCESGLFRERIPAGTVVPFFTVDQLDSITETDKKDVCILDTELWSRSVEEANLNKRAWVLQERLLSPRVLHFGKELLFWECESIRACETFPKYLPGLADTNTRGTFKNMAQFNKLHESGNYDENFSLCLRRWNNIYEAYMGSQLTHQTDRVVAIAGAADEIQSLLKTEYLAGLWSEKFEGQLTWRVKTPAQAIRVAPFRAPSWSWLAVEDEIKPPESFMPFRGISEILGVYVKLANPGFPTGEMETGYITVNAHLRDLEWTNNSETSKASFLLGKCDGDYDPESLIKDKFEIYWDTSLKQAQGTGYIFSIQLRTSAYGNPTLEGLILIPTSGEQATQMCRIGAFKTEGNAVCQILQHDTCRSKGCSNFRKLGGNQNSIPRAHQNLMERYAEIRREADAEESEADRIAKELEASYVHGLQRRNITIA